MRLLSTSLLILFLGGTALDALEVAAAAPRDCTTITSAVERLACFDAAAGTPAAPPRKPVHATEIAAGAARSGGIAERVSRNESARPSEDSRFMISEEHDPRQDQSQVVISAPALGSVAPRPYLAISCLSNISRIQLVVGQVVERNQVRMRLMLDGRPVLPSSRTWQVLEVGNVVDAGRGLVAIEQLRRLGDGSRLQIESDYPPFDGLVFDATGLKELIARQRKACHW